MISDADRKRIESLPVWARAIIARLELAAEPALEEAARARREATAAREQTQRFKDANNALMEVLACAGRSGIDWAAKVVDAMEGYSVFKDGCRPSIGDKVKVVKWRDGGSYGAIAELLFHGEVVNVDDDDAQVKVVQANRGWKVGDLEVVAYGNIIREHQ